ncbi:MAG: hypothetical protein AAF626_03160 [Pseudomonadota bacterium]
MSRTEFIALMATILFVAFVLGWFAHWLMHRFALVKSTDMNEVDRLASQVTEALEQRDQAVAYYQQRERELSGALHQSDAELKAAMDGLHMARKEAEDLRGYIERVNQAGAAPEVPSAEPSRDPAHEPASKPAPEPAPEAADKPVEAAEADDARPTPAKRRKKRDKAETAQSEKD